jgi:uncharacterized protein (DUF952 family)
VNIFHIASKSAWIEATRSGSYSAESLEAEGFIHCSTAAQVLPVARSYYRGRTDLVLLAIDTNRLESPLKWEQSEPPPGVDKSAAFPHVYGPIELDAVAACLDLEPDEDGEFVLPALPHEDSAPWRP